MKCKGGVSAIFFCLFNIYLLWREEEESEDAYIKFEAI